MEETFTPEPQAPAEQPQGIVLLQDAQAYLVTAGRWARFLGILGYITAGLLMLAALFVGTIVTALSGFSPIRQTTMAPIGLMSFYYILIAAFYFFVSLYLYQFGTRVKNGVAFNNSTKVTSGLEKLKSMLKLIGVVAVVMLVLCVFVLIGVAIFVSHMHNAAVTPGFN